MSASTNSRNFTLAALTMSAFVALASSGVSAMAKSDHNAAKARDYQAAYSTHVEDRCLPANGAQIMGGFAGSDDRIDSVTGEICRK